MRNQPESEGLADFGMRNIYVDEAISFLMEHRELQSTYRVSDSGGGSGKSHTGNPPTNESVGRRFPMPSAAMAHPMYPSWTFWFSETSIKKKLRK
jgi:hypothetical protein